MSTPSPAETLNALLLAPILLLMAFVVLYGGLLVVLTRRRLGHGSPRLRSGSATIGTSLRRDARERPMAVTGLVSSDPEPARFLIVVSRQDPSRYQELGRIFGDIGNTDVIVDRRQADPHSRRIPTPMTDQHAERRQRHIEDDLRRTGWALLRLTG